MKEWIVYKITNYINDKVYVGITCRPLTTRWRVHVSSAKRGKTKTALYLAIAKYGPEKFSISVVTTAVDFIEAAAIERGLIAQWGTLVKHGYNMTTGGEARWGRFVSLEVRAKMSAAAKARSSESRKMSPEAKRNCSLARLAIMTPGLRANIGNFHRGKVMSDETRAKLRAAALRQHAKA